MFRRYEGAITLALYALIFLIMLTSVPGFFIGVAWLCIGMWLNIRTETRGVKADASFIVTWPIYLYMEVTK